MILWNKLIRLKNSNYDIIKSTEGGYVMLSYGTVQIIIQSLRMVLDIVLMWILLYYTLKIVRNNSRTIQIFKGIILVLVVQSAATFFGFRTVAWMANTFVTWGFLAVIIIFQPEIRSLLEKLGKSSVFTRISTLSGTEKEQLVDELVIATTQLSEDRIGALITIEQSQSLIDYIRTGSPMNSIVTSDVLRSIFSTSTPIHDGAVIIQGDRISCASAYFPPTNLELPSRYGARHRAALGISEITDSITIVVSEETGKISVAEEGSLIPMNETKLREYLNRMIIEEEVDIDIKKDKPKRGLFTAKVPVEVVVEDDLNKPLGASQSKVVKNEPLIKRIFIKKEKSRKSIKPVIEIEKEEEKLPTESDDVNNQKPQQDEQQKQHIKQREEKDDVIEVESIEQAQTDESNQTLTSEDLKEEVKDEDIKDNQNKQGGEDNG